jgi:hypothetical protein
LVGRVSAPTHPYSENRLSFLPSSRKPPSIRASYRVSRRPPNGPERNGSSLLGLNRRLSPHSRTLAVECIAAAISMPHH